MINYSIKDGSDGDLEQYIYVQLLTSDNVRLNHMYNSNKLRNFISQIILNQRNTGNNERNTEYSKYLHIRDNSNNYENLPIIDETEYDYRIDIIIDYIDKRSEMVDGIVYTSPELKNILAFTVLKKYYLSDLTQTQLAKHLGICRSTLNNLIKISREDTFDWWNRIGQHKV